MYGLADKGGVGCWNAAPGDDPVGIISGGVCPERQYGEPPGTGSVELRSGLNGKGDVEGIAGLGLGFSPPVPAEPAEVEGLKDAYGFEEPKEGVGEATKGWEGMPVGWAGIGKGFVDVN